MVNIMTTTNFLHVGSTIRQSSAALTTDFQPLVPASALDTSLKFGNSSANSIQVTSPKASVGGKSQASWGDEWWKWIGKWFDSSGTVNYDQPGPVYFLPGTFSSGNVTVPTGEHIFTPILNVPADNSTSDGLSRTLTIQEERALNKSILDAATGLYFNVSYGSTTISPIQNWTPYRQVSPSPFSYVYQNTTFYNAVSDGYWVMLNPLSPGTYTINFGGTFNFENSSGAGVIDIDGDGNVHGQSQIEAELQKIYEKNYGGKSYSVSGSYTVTVTPKGVTNQSGAKVDVTALT